MPDKIKKPHNYQQAGRQWTNRQLNQFKNPALVMPAGSGKTFTAALIIKDRISLKKRLLVLCGTEEIFDQWQTEFSHNDIDYGYINQDGIIGRNKKVYICMWQSLFNMLDALPEKFIKSFHEIIIDETHHASSPTIRTIFDYFSHCLKIGLTATLFRMDNQNLGEFFDVMYEPIKQSEAIKKGYLCEPIIIMPDQYKNYIPENIENININDQKSLLQPKKIIGDMIKIYKDIFNGALCMIACSSHQHALVISKMYRDQGWIVEHLHGTLNKWDRKRIIRQARQNKINIIVTYAVGTEGLDLKEIQGVIWMRLTESLTVWIQLNTRAARVFKGKKNYVLIDPMGNLLLHGSPALDRNWTLDTDYIPGQNNQDDTTMKLCPVCSVMNAMENVECWICRFNFIEKTIDGKPVEKKKRHLPKMIDGELVFLNEENFICENINLKEDEYGKIKLDFIMGDNNSAGIETNGNGKENNKSDNGNGKENNTELTKIEKMSILSKDLTGLRMKNKFKDGIGWL